MCWVCSFCWSCCRLCEMAGIGTVRWNKTIPQIETRPCEHKAGNYLLSVLGFVLVLLQETVSRRPFHKLSALTISFFASTATVKRPFQRLTSLVDKLFNIEHKLSTFRLLLCSHWCGFSRVCFHLMYLENVDISLWSPGFTKWMLQALLVTPSKIGRSCGVEPVVSARTLSCQ